jgi:hypothetical protein
VAVSPLRQARNSSRNFGWICQHWSALCDLTSSLCLPFSQIGPPRRFFFFAFLADSLSRAEADSVDGSSAGFEVEAEAFFAFLDS